VYLPIFCVEAGLGDKIGGMVLSASNSLLFISPFMLRFATKTSLRRVMRVTLCWCAVTFILASAASPLPWATVVLLSLGSIGLVMLDATGGLPFMMSVKPSERSEMAAVYSSFRDVSGIATPGVAYLVLLAAPLAGIFAASGVGFAIAFAIAGYMHPRLGTARPSHGGAVRVGAGISPASVAQ
ncbi:MAG: MFS transporter, partial [Albidovulum sp.]